MTDTTININISESDSITTTENVPQTEDIAAPELTAVKLLKMTEATATIGGYGVVFGGEDLEGDTFTADTDFSLDMVPTKDIYYDHSQGDIPHVIGKTITEKIDEIGIWVEAELDRSFEYASAVLRLVEAGVLGWSSGSAEHLARIERTGAKGFIKKWPVIEYSLTPTPAEPRTLGVQRLKQIAESDGNLQALIPEGAENAPDDATTTDDDTVLIEASTNIASAETRANEKMEVMKMTEENKRAVQPDPIDVAAIVAQTTEAAVDATMKAYRDELSNENPINTDGGALSTKAVSVVSDPADRPFKTFGDQLKAIAQASVPGGKLDRRLLGIKSASGQSEGIPSEGGFLVQQDFATELFSQAFAQSEILSRVRSIPIGANANGTKIVMIDETSRANGSRWGGVQAYWADEAGTVDPGKVTFRRINLDLKKIFGLAYATEENLMDAAQLEVIIGQGFQEELTFKAEDSIINGSGAGLPLGILNSGCRVDVAKESGQAADTVVVENIDKMWARMHPRFKANAVWLMNPDVWPQLASLSRTVGAAGSTAFTPQDGVAGQPYSTLYGRPIIENEYSATVGDNGDLMLVDLSNYFLAQKGGQRADSSMHVRFLHNEMTFRVLWRLDGQPRFIAPLTPYKGTNTLSPFVAIAARS
ncbi:MAG: phage major capsid protein [Planctomycetaceae bacterium]|nr:phage major capsid protein [Planctomycetaceae bacterium]